MGLMENTGRKLVLDKSLEMWYNIDADIEFN